MDSIELIERVKSLKSLHSDYAAAKFLGISQTTLYGYRKKGRQMDDELAVRVAGILGLDAGEVLLNLHAARTDCPAVRKAFFSAAKRLHDAA